MAVHACHARLVRRTSEKYVYSAHEQTFTSAHKLVSARVGPRCHIARLRAHTLSHSQALQYGCMSTMQSCSCCHPCSPPGRAFDRLACPWTCLECPHLRGCRCPSTTARLWQNGSCHMQSETRNWMCTFEPAVPFQRRAMHVSLTIHTRSLATTRPPLEARDGRQPRL
jgi:hypothetical protein